MSVNTLNKTTRELMPFAGVPIGKLNLLETEKAEKTDLTNISITGEINTTGSTITQGTFFYLNNYLVRAIFDIENGEGLSETVNIEYITVGGLNKLNDDVVTLKDALENKGTEKYRGIYAGYISSSKNYFNFFIPIDLSHIQGTPTISFSNISDFTVFIGAQSLHYNSTNFDTSYMDILPQKYGIIVELKFKTTQSNQMPGTAHLIADITIS